MLAFVGVVCIEQASVVATSTPYDAAKYVYDNGADVASSGATDQAGATGITGAGPSGGRPVHGRWAVDVREGGQSVPGE